MEQPTAEDRDTAIEERAIEERASCRVRDADSLLPQGGFPWQCDPVRSTEDARRIDRLGSAYAAA